MKFVTLIFLFFSFQSIANDIYKFHKNISYTKTTKKINGKTKKYSINYFYYAREKTNSLLVTIHGYLDNCSYMKYVNQVAWKKNYSILCIELPGHGQSSGNRAEIDDFRTYKELITNIPEQYITKYSRRIYIGHSTGAIPILTYLRSGAQNPFEKIILMAPLIRSKYYHLSILGEFTLGLFTNQITRREFFQDKLKKHASEDPYFISKIKIPWFSAQRKWNQLINESPKILNENVILFFTDNDLTIDTHYNKEYLEKYFPNHKTIILKDASHHMDYDLNELSDIFFRKLARLL